MSPDPAVTTLMVARTAHGLLSSRKRTDPVAVRIRGAHRALLAAYSMVHRAGAKLRWRGACRTGRPARAVWQQGRVLRANPVTRDRRVTSGSSVSPSTTEVAVCGPACWMAEVVRERVGTAGRTRSSPRFRPGSACLDSKSAAVLPARPVSGGAGFPSDLGRRLMAGHRFLVPSIKVRILAAQLPFALSSE